MSIAYIGGTFDMMHYGHVRLFEAAQQKYDRVVVSLNTDEFTTRFKRPPIMNLMERMEMVLSCKYVDAVVVNFGNENSKPSIIQTKATHIIHGDDWTGPEYLKQLGVTEEWLQEHKIEVVYLPYTKGISTSELLRRVACRT